MIYRPVGSIFGSIYIKADIKLQRWIALSCYFDVGEKNEFWDIIVFDPWVLGTFVRGVNLK